MGLTQIVLPSQVREGGQMGTICLITPPSIFLQDPRVFPNLGILDVASSLERAGVKVEKVDLSGIGNFVDAVKDHILVSEAKYFGITATTPQLPAATQVAQAIREVRPDARIILGGPHITLVHAALKRENREGRKGRATDACSDSSKFSIVWLRATGKEPFLRLANLMRRSSLTRMILDRRCF